MQPLNNPLFTNFCSNNNDYFSILTYIDINDKLSNTFISLPEQSNISKVSGNLLNTSILLL